MSASWRVFGRFNAREHASIYALATLANVFLSVPEYLAVRQAVSYYVPIDASTARLISQYGLSCGLALDFLWTMAIFQAILTTIMLSITLIPFLERGWRVLYISAGVFVSGFVGYWLGAKFLMSLSWVSLFDNSGIDGSGIYSDLFWFGLAATVCYVTLILVLRKSYDKLAAIRLQPRDPLSPT
ncbi:MAG TPA: hypothetical protein VFV92_03000 [Candidatus Bathyarchaeia archaeon]|nr:hypothetical protein [Candidatus Bathyarchaeia archaeon]